MVKGKTKLSAKFMSHDAVDGVLESMSKLSDSMKNVWSAMSMISMPGSVIRAKFEDSEGRRVRMTDPMMADDVFFGELAKIRKMNPDLVSQMIALGCVVVKLNEHRKTLEHRWLKLKDRVAKEKTANAEKNVAAGLATKARGALDVVEGRICLVSESFFELRKRIIANVVQVTEELLRTFDRDGVDLMRKIKVSVSDNEVIEAFVDKERQLRRGDKDCLGGVGEY